MARQRHDEEALDVSPGEFKNMKLAIGTVDKTILEISLSDDLTETRHVDIRLQQNKDNSRGGGDQSPTPPGPGSGLSAAADRRLKITVAADQQGDVDNMRGWLLTVATLIVNMAFDAMLHPPDWFNQHWYNYKPPRNGGGWWPWPHHHHRHLIRVAAAAPSPNQAAAESTATTLSQYVRWLMYMLANMMTFAAALGLVLGLLAKRTWSTVGSKKSWILVALITIGVLITFILGACDNWLITLSVALGTSALYAYMLGFKF